MPDPEEILLYPEQLTAVRHECHAIADAIVQVRRTLQEALRANGEPWAEDHHIGKEFRKSYTPGNDYLFHDLANGMSMFAATEDQIRSIADRLGLLAENTTSADTANAATVARAAQL